MTDLQASCLISTSCTQFLLILVKVVEYVIVEYDITRLTCFNSRYQVFLDGTVPFSDVNTKIATEDVNVPVSDYALQI